MFIASKTPVGYLSADSTPVSRSMYLTLFVMIGTTFGEGDGSTTFNLPNLVGRFAKGGTTPGTVKEAGLPDFSGMLGIATVSVGNFSFYLDGGFIEHATQKSPAAINNSSSGPFPMPEFRGSAPNPIYGALDTVQPPALTLLLVSRCFMPDDKVCLFKERFLKRHFRDFGESSCSALSQ